MTPAALAAVSAVARRDGHLLLVRRGREPAAGQWSLPGGRVEFGEHAREAVVREVAEETALEVVVERFLGWAEHIGHAPAPHHYVVLCFAVVPLDPTAEPRPGDDVTAAAWVPATELPTYALTQGLLDFLTDHGGLDAPAP